MNNFQKFQNAYKLIILQSLGVQIKTNKIPGVSYKNTLYSPKIKQEFLKAFKNIFWIYDNNDTNLLYTENIITEAPGSIDWPGSLCNEILNVDKYKILKSSDILNLIDKDWKYFNQLKKYGLPIKIFKFNFSKQKQILNAFKLIYDNDEINELVLNNFVENKNARGAQLIFDDICILMFNTINYTKNTILHQFTHYLQSLLNVQKINTNQDLDESKLNFLKLSNNDLSIIIETLKDENQFIPNVNQFCENVHYVFKQYQKINQNLKWSSMFSEYFLKVILNSDNLKRQKLFNLYKQVSHNDLLSLYVIIGCYIYNIEWNKIKQIILETDKFQT